MSLESGYSFNPEYIISNYWETALRNFPSQLLYSDDRPITLAETLKEYNLKSIYYAGCEGYYLNISGYAYGDHDNPYLSLAYKQGWQDADMAERAKRHGKI